MKTSGKITIQELIEQEPERYRKRIERFYSSMAQKKSPKKLEKILKRARNGLIGLGLSGVLMLGAGCETMNSADWLAFSLGNIARDKDKTQEQREAAAYLEQIAKEQAKKEHERDIADRSRDETKQEVNVYVEKEQEKEKKRVYTFTLDEEFLSTFPSQQKEPEQSRYLSLSLSFNKWVDFNKNNSIELQDELMGVKDLFKKDEQIELYFQYATSENVKGEKLTVRIFGPGDNLALEDSVIIPWDDYVYTMHVSLNNDYWFSKEPGKYIAEWYSQNDKLLDSHSFRIIE